MSGTGPSRTYIPDLNFFGTDRITFRASDPFAESNTGTLTINPASLLITADNKTFTFGTDTNGYALFPSGKVKIYPTLASVPDSPLREGVDYLQEGTQLRIPHDSTYTGALYWRGIPPVADISATVQPALMPPPARSLIVLEAARMFQQDQPADAALLTQEYAHEFARWMLVYKTQFRSGGGVALSGLSLAIAANQ